MGQEVGALSHVAGSRERAQRGLGGGGRSLLGSQFSLLSGNRAQKIVVPKSAKEKSWRTLPAFPKGEGKAQKVERHSAKL